MKLLRTGTITDVSEEVGTPAWLLSIWNVSPAPVGTAVSDRPVGRREAFLYNEADVRFLLTSLSFDDAAIDMWLHKLEDGTPNLLPQFAMTPIIEQALPWSTSKRSQPLSAFEVPSTAMDQNDARTDGMPYLDSQSEVRGHIHRENAPPRTSLRRKGRGLAVKDRRHL